MGPVVGQSCSICRHPDAIGINEALILKRESNRAVACRYGLGRESVRRHREHIPELLARARDAGEIADADSLLTRVEGLYKRTEAILEAAERSGEWGTALAAIRECRGTLELLGRVTKELESAPTINFTLSPEWLELRAVVVAALAPYPDARGSVLRALEGGDSAGA